MDEGFIYEGLVGKYMRRRIKKKFDNIIAEIKRELLPVRKAKRKPKRKTLGEEVDDD